MRLGLECERCASCWRQRELGQPAAGARADVAADAAAPAAARLTLAGCGAGSAVGRASLCVFHVGRAWLQLPGEPHLIHVAAESMPRPAIFKAFCKSVFGGRPITAPTP